MKEQDHIWILMSRKLSGEASAEELHELEQWQQQHPDMTYSLQMLADLWQTESPKDTSGAEDAFDRHLFRMATRNETQADLQAGAQHRLPSLHQSAKEQSSSGYQAHPWAAPRTPGEPTRHISLWRDLVGNYFKISWRSLRRNKGFSAINISGLAIGLASAIVLLLWIQNELTFDQFHTKKDRIYQVFCRGIFDDRMGYWHKSPMAMAPVLRSDYRQDIEEVVRTNWVGAFIFSIGDKHISSQGLLTDPGFLKLFSFPLLKGNPATALGNPHSVVLTERLARKLFGKTDPLGQLIRVDSNANFVVSGVMKDQPPNTRFNFEYLIPWEYTKEVHWQETSWVKNTIETFVLLRPGADPTAVDSRIRLIIPAHAPDTKTEVFLHPMSKWHLYSEFRDGKAVSGQIIFVRMLAVIAGFILLIACINYMNLSTARSIRRAREVGIRKVVGAGRGSLIGRFLGESILIAGLAGFVALGIVLLALPWFNHLIETELTIPYTNPWFWLSGLGFILLTGLLAGSYPAFYLSAFRPINILRGHFKTIHALVTPRRVLVVFQFTFAITFIICTIVIYRELNYVANRDAGYDKNNLAFVYIKGDIGKNYDLIRRDLFSDGVISGVTRTNSPISEIWSTGDSYQWPGKEPQQRTEFVEFRTDRDFASTMGLKMIAGRDIDIEKYPTDSTAILLSEAAVKQMGLTEPIGQLINNHDGQWHVVGVVQDFVTGSLFNPILPIVVQGPHTWFGTITLKLNPQNNTATNLKKLADVFKRYNPDYPFDYYLVDKFDTAKLVESEHFGTLAALFSGMAIFISCLGLFGLATYMAETRLREVGVRKVLGASIMRITTLLSKDFLLLVIIAFFIASPIAWWCMRQWLEDIPYRIDLNWWIFALSGLLSLLIAAGTVGFQAINAALSNPVRILRTD